MIYLVYENADQTEGRGPMVQVRGSGYFTNEEEAWKFANTRSGVMGVKPKGGDWRNEKHRHVEVRSIHKHTKEYAEKVERIKQKESELNQLKHELKLIQRGG